MSDVTPATEPLRKRPLPQSVTVEKVEQITPRLKRLTLGGAELANFGPPRPGAHMKILFPPEGEQWLHAEGVENVRRPPSRTFTPRRYNAGTNQLDVEFVLHGDGLASSWAESAKIGDQILIRGPGGGYDIPAEAKRFIILADETAMPAAGTILEALPSGCSVAVYCEVIDADDERTLSATFHSKPVWLHRTNPPTRPGSLLEEAVTGMTDIPENANLWIACEAGSMRRIRQHLLEVRRIPLERLHTRGYWKAGEINHPDHDYGTD